MKELVFFFLVDPNNLLSDVSTCTANPSDCQENVVLQEIPGEHLNVFGEGGAKHQHLAFAFSGHVTLFNDVSDLGFETHIQHSVSFVQDYVPDKLEADFAPLEEISQSSWCGDEQVATPVQIPHLSSDVRASVHNAGSDVGSERELARLIVDLTSQLSGRRKNDSQWE